MMFELPENFKTARGLLAYSTMDTGDRYVTFMVEPEDWDVANEGMIAGVIIPAEVGQEHLDQVLGEIRDHGGVRFIIIPPRRPRQQDAPPSS